MKAPRRFHKAFRELPAAWLGLSYLKRSIMQDVWRMSSDDHSGLFETRGDPAEFIVRALNLKDKRERPPAIRAANELLSCGALVQCEGGVRVELSWSPPGAISELSRSLPGVIPEAKVSESLNRRPTDQRDQIRSERESESARAPAAACSVEPIRRRPLPPEPPNLPPRTTLPDIDDAPNPGAVVWRLYTASRGGQPGEFGPMGVHAGACEAIAQAFGGKVTPDFERGVRGLLERFNGDEYVRRTRSGIGLLAKQLDRFRFEERNRGVAPAAMTEEQRAQMRRIEEHKALVARMKRDEESAAGNQSRRNPEAAE